MACCRLTPFHVSTVEDRVRRYPSDTTDAQWAIIDRLLPSPAWLAAEVGSGTGSKLPPSRHAPLASSPVTWWRPAGQQAAAYACAVARQLSPLTRSEDDRRTLIVWAVACAERVLPLFEEASRGDQRPRQALAGALAFSRSEVRIGVIRQLAAACHAAARHAPRPEATAAARACGHAAPVAHMAAHTRGVPLYARKALTLAHPGDPGVLDREDAWQRAHLPDGFTDFVYPDG
jgi:Imm-5 like putative immunity protein